MTILRPTSDGIGTDQGTNAVLGGMGDGLDETYLQVGPQDWVPLPFFIMQTGMSGGGDTGEIWSDVLPASFTLTVRVSGEPLTFADPNLTGFDLYICNEEFLANSGDSGTRIWAASNQVEWFNTGTVEPTTWSVSLTSDDLTALGVGPYRFTLQCESFGQWNNDPDHFGRSNGLRLHDWWVDGAFDGAVVPLPLRQVQRDDGLGRSVMRARGATSAQMSIRQRGYR